MQIYRVFHVRESIFGRRARRNRLTRVYTKSIDRIHIISIVRRVPDLTKSVQKNEQYSIYRNKLEREKTKR